MYKIKAEFLQVFYSLNILFYSFLKCLLKNFSRFLQVNILDFVKKKKLYWKRIWKLLNMENIRLFDLGAEPFNIEIVSFSDSIVQSL